MNFEQELRAALRREQPPADFAAKVLAKSGKLRTLSMPVWRRPVTWAVAAGITISAVVPTGVAIHRNQEKRRALEARRELILALSITRTQLRQAREKVQQATRHKQL